MVVLKVDEYVDSSCPVSVRAALALPDMYVQLQREHLQDGREAEVGEAVE